MIVHQMVARSAQSQAGNSVDAAAKALGKMSMAPPHPALRSAASAPSAPGRGPQLGLGGLAARRHGAQAPKLNVKDISRDMPLHLPPGGGPSGAGLGSGRPQMEDAPRKSPQATWGTPFANWGKIVYVSLTVSVEFFETSISPSLSAIHQVLSISMARLYYTLRGSTSPTDHHLR